MLQLLVGVELVGVPPALQLLGQFHALGERR